MQTIRLQVSSGAIKHLMRFLSRFKKEEIRIMKLFKVNVMTMSIKY